MKEALAWYCVIATIIMGAIAAIIGLSQLMPISVGNFVFAFSWAWVEVLAGRFFVVSVPFFIIPFIILGILEKREKA